MHWHLMFLDKRVSGDTKDKRHIICRVLHVAMLSVAMSSVASVVVTLDCHWIVN